MYCVSNIAHAQNPRGFDHVLKMAGSIVSNAAAKSEVWTSFGFPASPDGSVVTKTRVVCRICKQEMPYKNNTTNLYSHLERHHKDEYVKLRKSGTTPVSSKG